MGSIMLVGSRGRVGLVTWTPNGHLPDRRLYLEAHFTYDVQRTTGGVFFCPLDRDRAVGVNPGFSLREQMRLVVLVPQHQTAVYETHN
jgi:hypothetical protein